MSNLKNKKELRPNQIFPYINFNHVKKQLRTISDDYVDFGSVFLIKNKNISVSVNEFGKIILFYNHYDENEITDSISFIEDVFKQQINEFCLTQIP